MRQIGRWAWCRRLPLLRPILWTLASSLDTNPGQDSSVLYEGISTIGSLAIDAGDALTIAEGAALTVGPVLNYGSLHINSTNTRGLRAVGTVVNAPGAVLSFDNGHYSSSSNQLFWNQSTTEGYGTIRDLAVQNDGLIDANVAGDPFKRLSLIGSTSYSPSFIHTLRNSGTLRASSGGTLQLSNWQTGGIVNQNSNQTGTIEALGNSTVLIENAGAITGGRITTSTEGGVVEGQIHFSGLLSLQGVELDADATIGHTSLIDSTFVNKRTLTLDDGDLGLEGVNVISGGGVLKLSHNTGIRFSDSTHRHGGAPKFVNVDNTVLVSEGASASIAQNVLVENHGVFEANGSNTYLKIYPFITPLPSYGIHELAPGEAVWTNRGVVRAVQRGRVIFSTGGSVFENAGGVLEVDHESSIQFAFTHIRGGVVRGPESESILDFNFLGYATLQDVQFEGVQNWKNDLTLIGDLENTGVLKSGHDITLVGDLENRGSFVSSDLLLGKDEVRLTGGGDISLRHVAISEENPYNSYAFPKLINVDNTLRMTDFGTSFGDNITFVNRGTVEASTPNINSHLSVSYGSFPSPSLINSGVIRAIDGASLDINYRFQIQNYEIDALGNVTPGRIQAGAGSEISLTGVSGGIVQAAVGGVIRVENNGYLGSQNTPTDLHLLGRIEAENVGLGGTVRNDGQLVVSGDIRSQDVTLLGNGELQLQGTLFTRNSTFINGLGHTIVGGGEILSESSFFTNEGRIEASDGNTLTITRTGPAFLFEQRGELVSSGSGNLKVEFGGQFVNRGTVRVAADARTTFDGNSPEGGAQFINANGAITDINGSLWVKDSKLVNEEGGVVQGDGQVVLRSTSLDNRRFINHGTLVPGSSVGQLMIGGDFQQSTTGDLEIELGGTALHEYDSLSAWSADLAGLLEVSLVDLGDGEFAPELGDNFEIISLLTNGSVTGEFDTFSLPTLAADLLWGIQYNPTSVVLEILAPLQADLDHDGDVDGSDFLALQRNDPSLISQWQTEYGSRVIISSPVASSQAVPEPTTFALLLPVLVLVLVSLHHNRLRKTAAHERRQRLPTSSTRA